MLSRCGLQHVRMGMGEEDMEMVNVHYFAMLQHAWV